MTDLKTKIMAGETLAAAAIIDCMMGGKTAWRERMHESDFLESADWLTALEYARAALKAGAA